MDFIVSSQKRNELFFFTNLIITHPTNYAELFHSHELNLYFFKPYLLHENILIKIIFLHLSLSICFLLYLYSGINHYVYDKDQNLPWKIYLVNFNVCLLNQ